MFRDWKFLTPRSGRPSATTVDGRLEYVDALRAYAILMMLQGHVIALTLATEWRVQENAFYAAWRHMRGVTAPTFFFASGLIIAYLLFRNQGRVDLARIKKNMLRAVRLLILGYIMQLTWMVPVCLFHGEPCVWSWVDHTHVLHTIAAGMLVVSALAYVSRRYRWLFPLLAVLLTHAAFVLGSMVAVQDDLPGLLALFSTYVLKKHAAFPVLTWMGFTLPGALVGFLVVELRIHRHAATFIVMLLLGYALKSNAWHILRDAYSVFLADYAVYLKYAVFTYYRLGEVFMVAGALGIVTRIVRVPSIIHAVGKETLGIFFLHAVVVYGAVFGFGMNSFLTRKFSPVESILTALLLTAVFMLYAAWAPRIRARFPVMKYLK